MNQGACLGSRIHLEYVSQLERWHRRGSISCESHVQIGQTQALAGCLAVIVVMPLWLASTAMNSPLTAASSMPSRSAVTAVSFDLTYRE